jgi:hypothetical protein
MRFGFPQDGQFRMMAMVTSFIEPPRQQYLASQLIATTGGSDQHFNPARRVFGHKSCHMDRTALCGLPSMRLSFPAL